MRFYPLNRIFGFFSHDIGIDLGTANTLVYVKGKGIVIREPSVVARNKKTKEVLAIGTSARKMLGKAPSAIEVVRPLRDGVISDFDATASMLSFYIKKVHESTATIPRIPRPKVIIGIPSGVTEVERRAVSDVVLDAGAREVHLIEEPMAAAIGAGLPVESSNGIFIVDGSMAGLGLIKNVNITIKVKDGYATEIKGGILAKKLSKQLDEVGRDARNIAEFGIGTNDSAKLSGVLLEDEKVMGTVHIALGNNVSMGGSVNVPIHLDGVIKKPTVYLDGQILMKNGKLLDWIYNY